YALPERRHLRLGLREGGARRHHRAGGQAGRERRLAPGPGRRRRPGPRPRARRLRPPAAGGRRARRGARGLVPAHPELVPLLPQPPAAAARHARLPGLHRAPEDRGRSSPGTACRQGAIRTAEL
ncbi:MAG: Transcriptional regulator, LysR family, partial [uncultured Acetobacteraceae bacterium]